MDDADAVRFTLLRDGEPLNDDALYRLYAYPDELSRCLVRGNAIVSLDGGATSAGTSGALGGPGDRRLFGVLRELADVIVVGAGTARAENYGGARMTAAARQRRQRRGQAEVPRIALVTRAGELEHDLPVLADNEVAPLVLTCAETAGTLRRRLGANAEVVDCSRADPARVDLAAALSGLADRGLLRVLTEGGPTLLGTFVDRGLLDELCLTVAPVMVGGAAVRIAAGAGDALRRMRRAHVMSDGEGYLYLRYIRGG